MKNKMETKTSLTFLLLCATMGVCQLLDEPECFVPGVCEDSFSIQIQSSEDELECLGFCQDEELCKWFTFFPSNQSCLLFENCLALDVETCPDCLSGQSECEFDEPMCWIDGKCEGTLMDSKPAEVQEECLWLCKSNKECKWFTFYHPGNACFLFSDCETFDETSPGCISGEKRCEDELTTTPTTSSSVTSTTSVTSTVSPSPVYSKVFVALGSNGSAIADVEIIDLLSSETICQKPENFPHENYYASGGLGFKDKPLICGGYPNNSPACHHYEDGAWKSSDFLIQGRYGFAMIKSPFQDESKLFLTGGADESYLSSSEVLTENGWQISVPLPTAIAYPCMVTINSISVISVGGYQNGQRSGRSFLFNSETKIWTEGPTLNTSRYVHSCGSIRKNSQTQDKSVITVGGWTGSVRLSSVEVLDLDSNTWGIGPDLPFGIRNAAMVEDPSGGVVLIGGNSDSIEYLDTLYRLPHAGSDATWELMTQKLKTKRTQHTAFLIPDDVAACN